MAGLKAFAVAVSFVCMYVAVSEANNVYYPAPQYGWAPWSKWCDCTKKCGGGEQWRTRKCLSPQITPDTPYTIYECKGDAKETRKCNVYQCPVNGGYGAYGPYDKCSKSCGGGYQTCYRKCNSPAPQYGGKPCSGPASKTRACNVDVNCPVNGGYGNYGPYGKCSKTCGGGYQTCYRKCNKPAPQYGGKPCSGPNSKTRACNVDVHCPINGGYGAYGPYDKCSKTCGGGYQTCYRKCNNPAPQYGGNPCSGPKSKTRACNVDVHCPVDGKWGAWSTYIACSKTCNGGVQKRHRKCDSPAPKYGGKDCPGKSVEERPCGQKPCPVKIGFVKPLYRVNEDVGTVVIQVSRSGDLSKKTKANIAKIPGGTASDADHGNVDQEIEFDVGATTVDVSISIVDDDLEEKPEYFGVKLTSSDPAVVSVQPDTTKVVIIDNDVDGKWGQWTAWTTCDKTCGNGSQSRSRKCDSPAPKGGGKPCQGPATETRKCYIKQYCPIDGGYGDYGPYDKCSKSCGGGYQTCYRKCNNPAPQYGGNPCSGPKSKTRACNVDKHCPVHGGYSAYGPYGPCSKTCGGGYQTCYRKCDNPAPLYGGNPCSGPKSKSRACNVDKHCPVHGGYGAYGPYGPCSTTCGGGYQTCYRKCDSPAPLYGGNPCSGPKSKTRACNVDKRCPVPGAWSDWSPYGPCSKTCGGGTQTRSRTCTNPAPAYGGKDCYGRKTETRKCNEKVRCPAKIGFKIASQTVNEVDAGTIQIDIIRVGGSAFSHSVSVSVSGGSATSGTNNDFTGPTPTNVNFPAGDDSESVSVTINDDSLDEQDETIILQLSTSDNKVTITQAQHTITIKDNDVDGKWGQWSPWSKCDKPCGYGSQSRSRKCDSPAPQGGGKPCQGPATQKRKCYIKQYCPILGGWSSWSSYGKCTKPCGGGYCYRTRTCTNPKPQYGGKPCTGSPKSSKVCNTKCCKVNGGYGAWSKWSPCSITCRPTPYAVGYQKRTRICNNPYPACDGASCYGPKYEKKPCTPYAPCPVYTAPPPAY